MANSRSKKKMSMAARVGVVLLSLGLIAIIAFAGAWGAGFAITGNPNPNEWGNVNNRDEADKPNTDVANGTPTDGMTVSTYSTGKLRMRSTHVMASETAMTDSTFYISATVEPADADDQELIWSEPRFENPNSAWAKDKTATDFVTLQPTSDTHNATLTCLGAFGEPITVTARSVSDPDIFATCTCNYVKRVKNIVFSLIDPTFNSDFGYTYEIEPTAYTVDSDFAFTSVQAQLTNEFAASVISRLPDYRGGSVDDDIYGNRIYMTIDAENQTLRFSGDKPNCLFYFNIDDDGVFGGNRDAMEQYKPLLDTAFRQAVKEYTGQQLWLVFDYEITHNGVKYGSSSQGVYINFNYESVRIHVSNIKMSDDNILM